MGAELCQEPGVFLEQFLSAFRVVRPQAPVLDCEQDSEGLVVAFTEEFQVTVNLVIHGILVIRLTRFLGLLWCQNRMVAALDFKEHVAAKKPEPRVVFDGLVDIVSAVAVPIFEKGFAIRVSVREQGAIDICNRKLVSEISDSAFALVGFGLALPQFDVNPDVSVIFSLRQDLPKITLALIPKKGLMNVHVRTKQEHFSLWVWLVNSQLALLIQGLEF